MHSLLNSKQWNISLTIVLLLLSMFPACDDNDESSNQETQAPFQVKGIYLTDACGDTVILKGVNKMSVFDETDPNGEIYFPEIAKTNANCVRIVWQTIYENGSPTQPSHLETLIKNCIQQKMIPMVELHDATCNWSKLSDVVNYWIKPDMVTLIQRYEHALLINIANEAGDETVTESQFLQEYKTAITKLRTAGINTPLIIDASGCGKDLNILVPTASALIQHDPNHNVMFSVHPYWSKTNINYVNLPTFIEDQLQKAATNKIPLILGELCGYGGWPGPNEPNTASCEEKGAIDYQTLMAEAASHDFGYLVWEWGPGNGFYEYNPPVLCPGMDVTTNGTYQSILNIAPATPRAWIKDVILDSPYSIKNTSVKTNYLLNGFQCQ